MELDISLERDSLSVQIENPFHLDIDAIMKKVDDFLTGKGESSAGLDIPELLPRMVKGIAGCEKGCPADAKSLVSRGFGNFELQYIEGGILTARTVTGKGNTISVKMFPEF